MKSLGKASGKTHPPAEESFTLLAIILALIFRRLAGANGFTPLNLSPKFAP